jgi:aspartate dehydrogenase
MRPEQRRIALIGFGAIGNAVAAALGQDGAAENLVGILERPETAPKARAQVARLKYRVPVLETLDALLALTPDMVIEAAGHGAVRAYGADILKRGHDLLLSSVGALADRSLSAVLVRAAADTRTEVWAAAGAVAGLDGLLAARTAGLAAVTYTSIKAPHAWMGTPAEKLVNRAERVSRTVFFEGTAREAAATYPQNANVAATIALAGLGLDKTQVCLAADSAVAGPLGLIDASGDFGYFRFELLALASQDNPKTSLITGHSMAAALTRGMCFRLLPQLRIECLGSA